MPNSIIPLPIKNTILKLSYIYMPMIHKFISLVHHVRFKPLLHFYKTTYTAILKWQVTNFLILNHYKTEIIFITTKSNGAQANDAVPSINFGSCNIEPLLTVKDWSNPQLLVKVQCYSCQEYRVIRRKRGMMFMLKKNRTRDWTLCNSVVNWVRMRTVV